MILSRLKITVVTADLLEDYRLGRRAFDTVVKTLSKNCESTANKILAEVNKLTRQRAQRPEKPAANAPVPSTSTRRTRSSTASPSKSAMKGKASESSPSKLLARGRGVSFNYSTHTDEDDEDVSLPETPTKKRRVDSSPSKSASSSNDQGLLAFKAAMAGHTTPNKVATMDLRDPIPADDLPTTPARPAPRRATYRSAARTNTVVREASMDIDMHSDTSASPSPSPPPRRRFRPTFLDKKQWMLRDPRVLREWPAIQDHAREMTELYGHPFAAYMPDFEMHAV